MDTSFSIVQLMISVLLFFVMFFGIGFLLNMLLRMTWLMAIVYPIVVLLIIDDVGFFDYFTNPGESFTMLGNTLTSLTATDIAVLSAGMAGAITSGIVMKVLRKMGYQMF
ncbi:purine-cytosine permease-like protein [Planomicrobium koreense]|uniref:Purine-cytosine permease-like protein n=1 Tax=Planococcus koreensis TaxID=112331 RepID=A0A7W8FVI3_9BACL|nr:MULTISPECIES: YuiB family protein [Planococcus]MBB5180892.1 purine-cytosine permease-like protein [Planococcus koreensis]MDN3450753.1 YuiB family protein [Planococcus sp. APC 3906]